MLCTIKILLYCMHLQTVFYLNKSEISSSFDFAEKATYGRSQSKRDFGSQIIRTQKDQIADISEGKMAEIGFKHFLETNFRVDVEIDFNHYSELHEIDFGSDIEEIKCSDGNPRICTYKIDVKTTRPYSQWLLVEGHKFWSNAYVLVKTDLPRNYERDPYSIAKSDVKTEITGFAYHYDFIDPLTKKPWIGYSRGDCLLNPKDIPLKNPPAPVNVKELLQNSTIRTLGLPLKSPTNYGIPILWLRNERKEWEKLIECINYSSIGKEDQIILKHI